MFFFRLLCLTFLFIYLFTLSLTSFFSLFPFLSALSQIKISNNMQTTQRFALQLEPGDSDISEESKL